MKTANADALVAHFQRVHDAFGTALDTFEHTRHQHARHKLAVMTTLRGKQLTRVVMPARSDRAIARDEQRVQQLVAREFVAIKNRVLALLGHHVQKFAKAGNGETLGEQALREFLDALNAGQLKWTDATRHELRDLLAIIGDERSTTSLKSLARAIGSRDLASMLTQANQDAVDWAHDRIGNLVTDVSNTTRNAINEITAKAIDAGWTNDEMARELEKAWEFSGDRALVIARTETAFAESAGTLAGYRASGVVEGKGWSTEDPCDECADNEDAGIIALDDVFPSGDDGPPAHPSCRCALYAAVIDA